MCVGYVNCCCCYMYVRYIFFGCCLPEVWLFPKWAHRMNCVWNDTVEKYPKFLSMVSVFHRLVLGFHSMQLTFRCIIFPFPTYATKRFKIAKKTGIVDSHSAFWPGHKESKEQAHSLKTFCNIVPCQYLYIINNTRQKQTKKICSNGNV